MGKYIKRITAVLITLTFLIFTFSGCSNLSGSTEAIQETKPEEPTTVETEAETHKEEAQRAPDTSKQIEENFNSLDKNVGNIDTIFKFIDQNIEEANPKLADEMVYTAIKLCDEYKADFINKFNDPEVQNAIHGLAESLDEIDPDALKEANNQKVKDLIAEAINKKYKLIAIEGFIEPIIDYQAYNTYRPYLTEEMNDYLDIKEDESKQPAVMDAAITIPIDNYIERILKSMDYVEKYPGSARVEEIRELYKIRLKFYLGGIDNSPVFNSNQKILPEKLAEFENHAKKYSNTKFGEILASYLELLEQENYTRTQKVNDFLNNL